MAAKSRSASGSPQGVEELLFHDDDVSLCLLVNHRHRTLRIIDFRAGPTLTKRDLVLAAARREGVEKVFTLVERDEVSTWMRLGLSREGSIHAFYKRSDAWIMGALIARVGPVRARLRKVTALPEDLDAEPSSPASRLADRTVAAARRLLRDSAATLPAVKLSPAREADLRKAVASAQRSGRALTGFEAFGRDVVRDACLLSTRGGFELYASCESQLCFANSLLEILTGPRNDTERLATTAAVRAVCEKLATEGIASAFSLSPADDVPLAAVYLATGFRRSGVAAQHLLVQDNRKDAIVWSRKLTAGVA